MITITNLSNHLSRSQINLKDMTIVVPLEKHCPMECRGWRESSSPWWKFRHYWVEWIRLPELELKKHHYTIEPFNGCSFLLYTRRVTSQIQSGSEFLREATAEIKWWSYEQLHEMTGGVVHSSHREDNILPFRHLSRHIQVLMDNSLR